MARHTCSGTPGLLMKWLGVNLEAGFAVATDEVSLGALVDPGRWGEGLHAHLGVRVGAALPTSMQA